MTSYSKKSTGHPVRKMADGGSVGFFERMRAGNIDDPSSEAYRRWGEGSKRAVDPAAPAEAPAPAPSPAPAPAPASTSRDDDYDDSSSRTSTPLPDAPKSETKSAPKARASAPARKAAPQKRGGGSEPDYGNEGRKAAPAKQKMFGDSRAKTKAFDAKVKDAAVRNRESAAEVDRESRRGAKTESAEKKKVLSTAGLNPKTLLPTGYANGGVVGKGYGKK